MEQALVVVLLDLRETPRFKFWQGFPRRIYPIARIVLFKLLALLALLALPALPALPALVVLPSLLAILAILAILAVLYLLCSPFLLSPHDTSPIQLAFPLCSFLYSPLSTYSSLFICILLTLRTCSTHRTPCLYEQFHLLLI